MNELNMVQLKEKAIVQATELFFDIDEDCELTTYECYLKIKEALANGDDIHPISISSIINPELSLHSVFLLLESQAESNLHSYTYLLNAKD